MGIVENGIGSYNGVLEQIKRAGLAESERVPVDAALYQEVLKMGRPTPGPIATAAINNLYARRFADKYGADIYPWSNTPAPVGMAILPTGAGAKTISERLRTAGNVNTNAKPFDPVMFEGIAKLWPDPMANLEAIYNNYVEKFREVNGATAAPWIPSDSDIVEPKTTMEIIMDFQWPELANVQPATGKDVEPDLSLLLEITRKIKASGTATEPAGETVLLGTFEPGWSFLAFRDIAPNYRPEKCVVYGGLFLNRLSNQAIANLKTARIELSMDNERPVGGERTYWIKPLSPLPEFWFGRDYDPTNDDWDALDWVEQGTEIDVDAPTMSAADLAKFEAMKKAQNPAYFNAPWNWYQINAYVQEFPAQVFYSDGRALDDLANFEITALLEQNVMLRYVPNFGWLLSKFNDFTLPSVAVKAVAAQVFNTDGQTASEPVKQASKFFAPGWTRREVLEYINGGQPIWTTSGENFRTNAPLDEIGIVPIMVRFDGGNSFDNDWLVIELPEQTAKLPYASLVLTTEPPNTDRQWPTLAGVESVVAVPDETGLLMVNLAPGLPQQTVRAMAQQMQSQLDANSSKLRVFITAMPEFSVELLNDEQLATMGLFRLGGAMAKADEEQDRAMNSSLYYFLGPNRMEKLIEAKEAIGAQTVIETLRRVVSNMEMIPNFMLQNENQTTYPIEQTSEDDPT